MVEQELLTKEDSTTIGSVSEEVNIIDIPIKLDPSHPIWIWKTTQ